MLEFAAVMVCEEKEEEPSITAVIESKPERHRASIVAGRCRSLFIATIPQRLWCRLMVMIWICRNQLIGALVVSLFCLRQVNPQDCAISIGCFSSYWPSFIQRRISIHVWNSLCFISVLLVV
mmetsp:Transcript_9094/g.20555  ORF Transcript_9094/g.20555 Transcript_9094/m.20555 type:complete len:122 (+) Transcript_9094:677-1042(+)